MGIEEEKRLAGRAAAQLIESHMCVGLGTGSTVGFAIREIARRLQEGDLSSVTGVATSMATAALADKLDIPRVELSSSPIDVAIDGADEIAPDLSLNKGAGGALLREKIVASVARTFIVVADASKLVEVLGTTRRVPVEIARFGYRSTAAQLGELGDGVVRASDDGLFVTDGGNMIVDIRVRVDDPGTLDRKLMAIPGVLATGLFLDMATLALVAKGETVNELRLD